MSSIRVRFAPSPTGQLHFGGLRTALYNFLFAKSFNGKFLLRIEDTDRERIVPGSIEHIKSGLEWARIKVDEPTVIQSERAELYRKHLATLFGKLNHQNQPHIYRCFCTIDRLMLLRHECKRRSQPYRYDGRCKELSEKQQHEYIQQGLPHVIRFSLPTDDKGIQTYDDLVYGHHEHNPYATEGDFILLKSDGFPTYHLANVVDDHLMNISHVFRGHEWQTSTSKHLLLYKAFNWQPPRYGHLPLLERERGRKLSKRDAENAHNPIEIDYYRQKGYFPNAVLNFTVLCGGGGFKDDDTVIGKTLDEMVSLFDIKLFSRHAAIVDFKKLAVCQRAHFKREYQTSKEGRQNIIEELRQKVLHYYPEKNSTSSMQLQNDYLEKILAMIDFRIVLLDELFTNNLYEYLWKEPELKKDLIHDIQQFKFVIKYTLDNLNQIHFTHDDIKQFIENYRPNKINNKDVFRIWRLVLCGCLQGPPVHEIASFFGPDIICKRFQRALVVLDQQNENAPV
ncbi:unnamed protein product [Rotaria magnacalcarata]|uniref:Nondiscriminating glutamyl-tRNA synthetase EARS2, mitochondrial n=1 Tax=Rotaria magnacalcarata TaxID=392030 RepID=A0A819SZH7_9BILA|nr:unnamed protein product [Rotaria magnacalcarata]CAF2142134.1 unnamed protein product [Rotaria magnacalcarata]CAF4073054.1 unnamed protein product [Rotaria magnacalcarata]CAF4173528.1 unnamed protein product [Rotaria magnacalcarata]